MPWYYDPHSGGQKIPPSTRDKAEAIAKAFEQKSVWHPKYSLILRFRGQFCYVDAREGAEPPFPLGRLRHFSENSWSLAYFTYSNDQYSPCLINDKHTGTIEDALTVCEDYLF